MNKIALITGASHGIGASTAHKLAGLAYDIALNYLGNHKAAERVQAQVQELGVQALLLPADVSQEGAVVAMFGTIDHEMGCLDALVNNAGVLFEQTTVSELSAEQINKVLATNVTGPFLCCREAVKCMSTAQGGQGDAIVNVSSAAARLGAPGLNLHPNAR
ncbi:MAG: NAD(P)-dependent dehydrogenase (short-subunit alcohol dehydrogenase family) [Cryomorphaceae bacterium]|jgi:NAD(P)-dependent dehydrogenase (short-subunit alcohol dehydrogenase family)